MTDIPEINELFRQVTRAPVDVKLEIAAALSTHPRPSMRRCTSTVVRMALTELESLRNPALLKQL